MIKRKSELVEVQPLIDICTLVLQTAYLKPYQPSSLLLIAKPEYAKTSAIFQFSNIDKVYYTNEITAKLLGDIILPSAERQEIRHILIPDILNCVEKQKSTRQQFLNTMKSLVEEGVSNIQTYQKRFTLQDKTKPVKCGLITAITTIGFKEIRKYFENIGFLSRLIPFSYDYPISKIKKIFELIEGIETSEKVKIKEIRKIDTEIKGNPELFKEFEMIATRLGQEYKGFGSRALKNLIKLTKANALLNKRKEIKREDIDKIIELSNWINFDFNKI